VREHEHVELPEVEIKLATAQDPVLARVVGNERCTYGKSNAWIRNIALDVSGTRLAGAFHAGQAFGVLTPGTDEQGKAHKVRLYSIASPEAGEDGQGNVVCTPVKRVVDEHWPPENGAARRRGLFMGVCSNYLCDLEVGEEVRVTGPIGKRFLLPTHPERHHHVFVATGTGIAPFRGMVLELLRGSAGNAGCEIWLFMGSPYTTDLIYHELFLDLASRYSNFHYRQAISREPGPEGTPGIYVDTLFERELDRVGPLLAGERTVLYLCGLIGMQYSVFRRLAMLGLLEGYATVEPGVVGPNPADWTPRDMKRGVKPTESCMIEVY